MWVRVRVELPVEEGQGVAIHNILGLCLTKVSERYD